MALQLKRKLIINCSWLLYQFGTYVKDVWETYKKQETSINFSRDIMGSIIKLSYQQLHFFYPHAYPFKFKNLYMAYEDLFYCTILDSRRSQKFYHNISYHLGRDFIVQYFYDDYSDYRNVSMINDTDESDEVKGEKVITLYSGVCYQLNQKMNTSLSKFNCGFCNLCL